MKHGTIISLRFCQEYKAMTLLWRCFKTGNFSFLQTKFRINGGITLSKFIHSSVSVGKVYNFVTENNIKVREFTKEFQE